MAVLGPAWSSLVRSGQARPRLAGKSEVGRSAYKTLLRTHVFAGCHRAHELCDTHASAMALSTHEQPILPGTQPSKTIRDPLPLTKSLHAKSRTTAVSTRDRNELSERAVQPGYM